MGKKKDKEASAPAPGATTPKPRLPPNLELQRTHVLCGPDVNKHASIEGAAWAPRSTAPEGQPAQLCVGGMRCAAAARRRTAHARSMAARAAPACALMPPVRAAPLAAHADQHLHVRHRV